MSFPGGSSYIHKEVRASAVLTNSYVAAEIYDISRPEGIKDLNQVVFYIDFTKGSLTSFEVKVEFSNDINFSGLVAQETFTVVTGGTNALTLGEHTATATGTYRLDIPVKDKFIRISAKGTGTVTNSLMAIEISAGTV